MNEWQDRVGMTWPFLALCTSQGSGMLALEATRPCLPSAVPLPTITSWGRETPALEV